LGLLSIPTQTAALAGRIMLWAVQDGRTEDVLRELLQHYIREKSQEHWGIADFTWMFVKAF
jgi:hypothetical protein